MPDTPLVSIVIPAYNARQFITRAIDSCLAQTYTNYEIIVIDDGSTDGTGDLVRDTYGDQVQVISQRNKGVPLSRNVGIAVANGEYIKPLDADDAMHSTFLEKLMARFAQGDEQLGLVYCQYYEVKGDERWLLEHPLSEGHVFCELLLDFYTFLIIPSAVILRKKALIAVGMFPNDADKPYSEDWDTFLRVALDYEIGVVKEPLVDRYLHDSNDTNDKVTLLWREVNTMEHIGKIPERQACMEDKQYFQEIANRYHKLAMYHWRLENKDNARRYLHRAIERAPQSRSIRRLYFLMTYIMPYRATVRLNQLLTSIRPSATMTEALT